MKSKNKVYTIAIVDDHTLLSEAIGELVNGLEQFHTLYSCSNGQALLDQLEENPQHPNIVLMDVKMPVLNGIETTKIIKEKYPEISVIALSVEEDEMLILQMMKAGANGYLVKDTKKEILEKALLQTIEKGFYYTDTVSQLLMGSIKGDTDKKKTLKDREKEFIRYACTEMTYKEIAHKMNLSPKTVENYRESVFAKLNVKNRVGLVIYALRNDLCK